MELLLPPEDIEEMKSAGHAALHDDLRRGHHVKAVLAVHRQARIAKAFGEAGPRHHAVFGQLTMVVDPLVYEEMRREHGAEIWQDADFRKRFLSLNPEARIRSTSGKTTILRP